ncbi:MAG: hypothetical protein K2M00_05760 [Muribaculaceae bacterium]|nr:hypothetical protein [Muribaculaceae bacterium]
MLRIEDGSLQSKATSSIDKPSIIRSVEVTNLDGRNNIASPPTSGASCLRLTMTSRLRRSIANHDA